MRKLIIGATLVLALIAASSATAAGWAVPAGTTNTVVSPQVAGGGYPDPPGASKPVPGTCGVQQFNSNHSESWLAVQPGTESIIGTSKFFTSKYSTFYNFYVGSYTIQASSLAATNQVQGYECTTVGTQAMPPSWTNSTDPNVDFDTKGRAYQTMLPFNAYWAGGLHPNSAIDVSYTDDLGRHWMKGNGGQDLEASPNQNSVTFGHVEDKQWIAVNHIVGNVNADHVYAMWTIFNGSGPSKIMVAVSRDRGQTFSKAVQLTSPSATTPANTYIYPSVGSDGTVYAAFVSGYDTTNKNRVGSVYVTWSKDDGVTWAPFVKAATPVENPNGSFANTLFRDGIIESFTASPTYPGHAYLTYENWDPAAGTSDVYFTQTIDGGATWSSPTLVNDDAATGTTDQFQPSIAAGSGGAVAVAFYDRRAACPKDSSILSQHRGATNTCIDVSVQAYVDSGAGAVPSGPNVRGSTYSWDPDQPGQAVDGLSQLPCAAHTDPCPKGGGFIGDYFGLAISDGNVYTLSVSTHYPSSVKGDDGSRVMYQQQVLGTIPRSSLGL
ncbi:MAG: sialidase family protein [Gaiellaceae bacterium]